MPTGRTGLGRALPVLVGLALVWSTVAGCSLGGGAAGPAAGSGGTGRGSAPNGGIARLALSSDPHRLDPAQGGEGIDLFVDEFLYTNLVRYGGKQGQQVEPNLAKSWKWSPGGRTLTFTLRSNLKFSDGSPLTTADVAFTVQRNLDPKTKGPYQGAFMGIVGAAAFVDGKSRTVSGIQVISPTRIAFHLVAPEPYFLNVMGLTVANIVSERNVQKYGEQAFTPQHFVGSGAFILTKWVRGQVMDMKKNPHYWWAGHPFLNGIHVQLDVTPTNQFLEFQRGQLDLDKELSPAAAIEAKTNPQLKPDYQALTGPLLYYAGMNPNVPPFNNVLVRRALNYAVDKQELVKLFNGRAAPMTDPIPPWMPGFDKSLPVPYPYNPTKARRLLAQAGLPHGFSTTLLTSNYLNEPQIAAALQEMLAKVGVRVRIKQETHPVYVQELRKSRTNVGFFVNQWGTDYPDPEDVMTLLLSGKTVGQQNLTYYDNPQVTAWDRQGDSHVNFATRMQYYDKSVRQVISDAPWIFEIYSQADALVSPHLQPRGHPAWFVRPDYHRNWDEVKLVP